MNIILNIGLNDKKTKKQEIDTEIAINWVGAYIGDCTITKTIGFYKGMRETSLKVNVYDADAYAAISLAEHFARLFNQECVALTMGEKTFFVDAFPSTAEYTEMLEEMGVA